MIGTINETDHFLHHASYLHSSQHRCWGSGNQQCTIQSCVHPTEACTLHPLERQTKSAYPHQHTLYGSRKTIDRLHSVEKHELTIMVYLP